MSGTVDHAEYFAANRSNWDDRAPVHAASDSYNLQRYREVPDHISSVVGFDRERLGDLSGTSAVHLQCHLGTDTLSLARLGADVAGVDQSPASLEVARQLFADTGTPGQFVEGNVYDAPELLGRTFDLVYTGVGAINWLPDIDRWAATCATLLNPGGRLYLRDGHPMLYTLDDERDDHELVVAYPYFETPAQPIAFDSELTYTGDDDKLEHTRTYEWNHGLGEVVTAVLNHGLELTALVEHRELEWPFFPWMLDAGDGRYRMPDGQADQLPLMYTLEARKPAS